MNDSAKKPVRGRPKTLDREHVLSVATQAYWKDGIDKISLNEICRRAGVSKPALYREFGNEDGLMKSALEYYYGNVLAEILKIFSGNMPFDKVLDLWVSISVDDSKNLKHPAGCLFSAMSNAQPQLGPASQQCVDRMRKDIVQIYRDWFARAKETGAFKKDISPARAARYLHAQLSYAMLQKSAGEADVAIKDVLKLAVSILK